MQISQFVKLKDIILRVQKVGVTKIIQIFTICVTVTNKLYLLYTVKVKMIDPSDCLPGLHVNQGAYLF
jgi:hypothetical protein